MYSLLRMCMFGASFALLWALFTSQNVRPSDSMCPVAPNTKSHFASHILIFPPPTNLAKTSSFLLTFKPKKFVPKKINTSSAIFERSKQVKASGGSSRLFKSHFLRYGDLSWFVPTEIVAYSWIVSYLDLFWPNRVLLDLFGPKIQWVRNEGAVSFWFQNGGKPALLVAGYRIVVCKVEWEYNN